MKHLSVQRWEQIDTLFAQALDRPSDERTAFLRSRCGNDPALYNEVVALLESITDAEVRLGESATELAARLLPELEAEVAAGLDAALDTVGPYHLVRSIGYGGMGVVYEARRIDGEFEHTVALKLVKRGMDTDEILRRFRTERQILASLQHPHIAQLYDGGATDDGRPYLVMEYVEGLPLDRYCDEQELDVDNRLDLFRTVCEAVQYAHLNLVVHRDLKPSNILVTREGKVKLLDFGIAKLMADDGPGDETRTRLRVMTPAYAAPEQVRGDRVTTATDVYALGVLLYELLTGHRPLGPSPGTAVDVAATNEPDRPSSAVSRRREPDGSEDASGSQTAEQIAARRGTTRSRLQRRLRGDLDTIVLKALRAEPARRYQSAEQVLEDLRRHRSGLPVKARPDTFGYRSRKFVRRHRFGVAAGGVLGALLIGFGAVMTFQQAATARERDRTAAERDKAERVVEVFTDMLQAADPGNARGDSLTVLEVLSLSRHRIDTSLADQPEVQGKMYSVLGRVYLGLGQFEPSQEMLEKALAIRQTVLPNPHSDLAESITDLANLAEKRGDYAAAEASHGEALSLREKLVGQGHPETLENLNKLASLLYRRGDLDGALAHLEDVLAVNRRAFGNRHLTTAAVLHDMGVVLKRREDFERADQSIREALEIRRTLLGDDHPLVLSTTSSLASLLSDAGKYGEAEIVFRDMLDARRRILGERHPDVALTLTGLAVSVQRQGRSHEAEALHREALSIDLEALGPDHPTVGLDMSTLAKVIEDLGKEEEALGLYEEALAVLRSRFPPQHPAIALPLVDWGRLLVRKGAYAEALPLLEEGLEIRTAGFEPGYWATSQAKGVLGACLAGLQRFDEAEALLLESYRLLMADRGPSFKDTQYVRRELERLYTAWGKPDLAAPYRVSAGTD